MRHASRARMKKRLKCYPTGGANVCVCVCVTLFSGVCKYKALKDAENALFSASYSLLYMAIFRMMAAKVNKVCETRKCFQRKDSA